ncbi:MAG: 1-acyl-sn-glycerol-3-phosphate acyltransferase [Planctomycetota bacterium]|nr:1-acyl-sn-glycerol-3-phosphate acyltransferase [Planctomycetota bacterium]
MPKGSADMICYLQYKISQFFAWFLFIIFFSVRVRGRRNIPKKGSFIVASSHQSYLDPILIGFSCPLPVSYLAKASLFKNPLFGALIRSYGAFEIERDTADLGALRTAVEVLKKGARLLLFPEGSRSSDGSVGEVKAGVFLIAKRADVPILPVRIRGAYKAWNRNSKFPRLFSSVMVEYGVVFRVEPGADYRSLCERLRVWYQADARAAP